MNKLDFPSSPVNGQIYSQNGLSYQYDGTYEVWVTTIVSPLPTPSMANTQVMFVDGSYPNGSYGLTFSKTANTTYANTISVSGNVSASYIIGDGSALTNVLLSLTPANNWANTVGTSGNAYTQQVGTAGNNYSLSLVSSANNWANTKVSSVSVSSPLSSTGGLTPTISLPTSSDVRINSLGVGTAASATAGEIRAIDNITAYYSSDISLKENVKKIENALNKLFEINGYEYDWSDEYIKSRGGEDGYFIRKHDVGVIAQEIEKVLPEIVSERENGIKAVKYDRIVPLLIEAIKELKTELDELRKN